MFWLKERLSMCWKWRAINSSWFSKQTKHLVGQGQTYAKEKLQSSYLTFSDNSETTRPFWENGTKQTRIFIVFASVWWWFSVTISKEKPRPRPLIDIKTKTSISLSLGFELKTKTWRLHINSIQNVMLVLFSKVISKKCIAHLTKQASLKSEVKTWIQIRNTLFATTRTEKFILTLNY